MKTVLFVCVGNASRSQMAEAFFNQAAGGKARAISAGTEPASAVDLRTVDVMREVGIDISGARPKALTMEMLDQAERVVTMGCGTEGVCLASFVESEDWQLEDPKGKPIEEVRRIRDEIRNRVAMMLDESKPHPQIRCNAWIAGERRGLNVPTHTPSTGRIGRQRKRHSSRRGTRLGLWHEEGDHTPRCGA